MCYVTKSDRWTLIIASSSIIPISLKIPGNKQNNYPWLSRYDHWYWYNWLNSCARSRKFTRNNLMNEFMKNFTLPTMHLAAIVLSVAGSPANIYVTLTNQVPLLIFKILLIDGCSPWKNVNFFLQLFLSMNKMKTSLKFMCR